MYFQRTAKILVQSLMVHPVSGKRNVYQRLHRLSTVSIDYTYLFSSVPFSSILEAGPGCGPLFPDLGILVLGRVPSGSVVVSNKLRLG